jgi:hypothetical protein
VVVARVRGRSEALHEGMFNFVTSQFDALAAKLPKDAVTRLPNLFDGACSDQDVDRVEEFFTPLTKTYTGLGKTRAQSLESVRRCAHLRALQRYTTHKPAGIFEPVLLRVASAALQIGLQ